MKTMKKLLTLALAALLLFSGCGKKTAAPASLDGIKTLGDALALGEDAFKQSGFSEDTYIYVFELAGTYYRAIADIPADVSEKLWDLEFDDDYDKNLTELITPLTVKTVENLSEKIPAKEELDKLVGKTGKELLDDGWSVWGYDLDSMQFYLHYGMFAYQVTFEKPAKPLENTDDFDEEAAIAPLKVESIAFDGIGDATDL